MRHLDEPTRRAARAGRVTLSLAAAGAAALHLLVFALLAGIPGTQPAADASGGAIVRFVLTAPLPDRLALFDPVPVAGIPIEFERVVWEPPDDLGEVRVIESSG